MGASEASDDENGQGSKAWKNWAPHVDYDATTADGSLYFSFQPRWDRLAEQANMPTVLPVLTPQC